jgi:hypothetical protein
VPAVTVGAAARSHERRLLKPCGSFPDGVEVDNGYVTLPDLPGIAFEGKGDPYREMRKLSA